MNLQQAIDQRRQNTENQFYTNLMQYGLRSEPQFDISGNTPTYLGGATKMPSKTQLWNQYVQIKGGRLAPQDLATFEQYYNNAVAAHRSNQIKGLQQLAMKGYSDKKIRNLVKDTPDLYNNLMDMVSSFENRGDEEGMMAGAQIRQYLPSTDRGILGDDETSTLEKVAPYAAAYTAYKAFQKDPTTGQRGYKKVTSKIPKPVRKYGKTPAAIAAIMAAPKIGEVLGGEEGRETAEYLVDKGVNLGMAGYGLSMLRGLSAVPHPIAKGVAGAGLLGYGLYNTFTGEDGLLKTIWGE